MATTIITKHGTGVPTTLAVGELAIDKSGPTLYTNAGSGVQQISSSGGGGGSNGLADVNGITFSGTLGNDFEIFFTNKEGTKISLKPKVNGGSFGTNDTLTLNAPSGKAFLWYHKGSSSVEMHESKIERPLSNAGGQSRNRIDFGNVNGTTDTLTMALDLSYSTSSGTLTRGIDNFGITGTYDVIAPGTFTCESITLYGAFDGTWVAVQPWALAGCPLVHV